MGVCLVMCQKRRLGKGMGNGEFEEVRARLEGCKRFSTAIYTGTGELTEEVVVNPRVCDISIVLRREVNLG